MAIKDRLAPFLHDLAKLILKHNIDYFSVDRAEFNGEKTLCTLGLIKGEQDNNVICQTRYFTSLPVSQITVDVNGETRIDIYEPDKIKEVNKYPGM